jgi:hypothetical protein
MRRASTCNARRNDAALAPRSCSPRSNFSLKFASRLNSVQRTVKATGGMFGYLNWSISHGNRP